MGVFAAALVLMLLVSPTFGEPAVVAPAWGQDYEKGMQAYDRGDYTVKMR